MGIERVFEDLPSSAVYAIHEHELRRGVDEREYERQVGEAIRNLRVPGLLHAIHLKGFKAQREGKYAVLWIFENQEAIVRNFGTSDNPKHPADWLHYENDVLAKFIDRKPDTINFTDYHAVSKISF